MQRQATMDDICPLFVSVFNILRESIYPPSSSSSSSSSPLSLLPLMLPALLLSSVAFALAIANALQGPNKRRSLVPGAFEKIFLFQPPPPQLPQPPQPVKPPQPRKETSVHPSPASPTDSPRDGTAEYLSSNSLQFPGRHQTVD